MKTIVIITCLFFSSTSIYIAQITTNKAIGVLINKAEKDSVAQIERLAALEFHKLINHYRKSKGLSSITWDETLWITTRNHNEWMAEANVLSHHQTKKNKYFTGTNPGDRFDFAAGGNSPNNWSGENALYNFSAFGNNIKEISNNIASRSFEQWKNSPGHNRNMLGKSHATHGTAFKIYEDKVWGTDLFASTGRPYSTKENQIIYTKKKRKKKARFSTFKTKRELTVQILNGLNMKVKKSKNSEAKKKAERLLNKRFKNKNINGVLYSKQTTTKTKGKFRLFSKNKSTYALVIEKDISDFDITEMTNQLLNLVKENQTTIKKSRIDLGIALRKRKQAIRLTLVCIIRAQPKKYSF